MKIASRLKLAVVVLFAATAAAFLVASAGRASASQATAGTATAAPGAAAPGAKAGKARDGHGPGTPGGELVGAQKCAECHSEKYDQFSATAHSKLVTDPHTTASDRGCEACHGPGGDHVKLASDPATADRAASAIFNPRLATPDEVAARCTRCHTEQSIKRQPFHVEHDPREVSCNDCHSPHQEKTNAYILIETPPALCLKCHAEVASDFRKPYHHKVVEGAVSCLDCHSAHGRDNTAEARVSAAGLDALCARCHVDKEGPFAFEHPALTRSEEGCLTCHEAHGSVTNRMLNKASVFQLCIQCHSGIGLSNDVRLGSEMSHDLADPRIQNCTTCHTAIHGSNVSDTFLQ